MFTQCNIYNRAESMSSWLLLLSKWVFAHYLLSFSVSSTCIFIVCNKLSLRRSLSFTLVLLQVLTLPIEWFLPSQPHTPLISLLFFAASDCMKVSYDLDIQNTQFLNENDRIQLRQNCHSEKVNLRGLALWIFFFYSFTKLDTLLKTNFIIITSKVVSQCSKSIFAPMPSIFIFITVICVNMLFFPFW